MKTQFLRRATSRHFLAAVFSTIAFVGFAWFLNDHYAIRDWLFVRYATYFALAAFLFASTLSMGYAAQHFCFPEPPPLLERLVVSAALGLTVFVLGWAALGFLCLLNAITFFVWPLICLATGAFVARRSLARLRRYARRVSALRRPLGLVGYLVLAFGVVGLLLVYAPLMTPQNIAFDARWYHLPLAERFALEHGIIRFPEGWMLAGYPPLPSLFYTWAFCLPGGSTFDRVELAAHLEFVWFLATLASVPVLVRKLLPRSAEGRSYATGLSWVAVFLFPGLFIYDSALSGAADHIAAFWAVPLYLLVLRAQKDLALGRMVALGLCVSGILLTKYTAYGMLVLPALWILFRLVYLVIKSSGRRWSVLSGPLALVLLVGVCWSPHWLKNWIWYGNPVFPALAEVFDTRPWTPEASARMTTLMAGDWVPKRNWDGVVDTLRQLYQFSFVPHNWGTFHRTLPVFGSLFTLTLPLVLVFRAKRLMVLCAAIHVGILYWFWTFHQDRYLQLYVPWMATVLAACLLMAWRAGVASRVAVGALVLLQAVWGGDMPFYGTHALAGQPLEQTIALLRGGFAQKGKERFVAYPEWEAVRKLVPHGGKVLRHENQIHLGIGVPAVTDWFQTGVSFGRAPSGYEMFATLEKLGVTHAVWQAQLSRGFDSLAADIAFFNYVTQYAERPREAGPYIVAKLPTVRPAPERLRALYIGCDGSFEKGLYDVQALNVMPRLGQRLARSEFPEPLESISTPGDVARFRDEVQVIVHDPRCMNLPNTTFSGFTRAAKRHSATIYVRLRDKTSMARGR